MRKTTDDMSRTTVWTRIRYLCRRHPRIMLYHVVLLIFVIVALIMITTSVPSDDEPPHKEFEKSEAEVTGNKFVVDPAMPLDRILDEELAEWITALLSEKNVETKKSDADDSRRTKKNNDNDDKPAIMVHGDDAMIDMEVLGQGGPFPRKVMKNYDRKLRPDLDPADLPVPRSLRKQMTKNNREGELAALEKPLPRAGLFQESEVHERPLDTKVGYPERADSRLLHVPASRGRDDEDTRQTRKDIGGFHVQNQKPTRRSNVLIVAAMRTGSSFVGELFQQRRDFFYMFEPGLLLMDKLDSLNLTRRIMVTKLIVMLNRFYQCRFDSMSFFIDLLNKKSLFSRKQVVPAIVTTQFCRKFPKSLHRAKVACPPVTERLLQTACQSRDHTAIKSIRILDINLMLDAIRNPEVDLKLLHLVRDPRSMIVSRLKLLHPKIAVFNESHLSSTQRNILDRYCSNWLQNYEVGHYVPSMRKNYLLVRYEDVALDPLKSAEVIYDFVGLGATIPSGVQNWVAQNTKVNDPSKKKSAAFSTKRDSRSVLVSWKRRITTGLARAIEHVGDCPRLMQVIGYTPIGSDSAKLEDDDDLVATLPDPLLNVANFDFL